MNPPRTGRLRILAPIGVTILAVVLLVVIATSLGGSGSGDDRGEGRGKAGKQRTTKKKFYVVEPGDSLTKIENKTGVSVEKLTRLNKNVDPQALISGEKIRLRRGRR